jgi:16S rRNA (guanine527-N7)-methyltransferase
VAIAERGLQMVSVDSVGKKINFQKHVKRKLQLDNVRIAHCRVEELESRGFSRESFDVVVTRAFSSLETIFNLTAGWVAPGGKMIAMKGAEAADEMKQLEVHLNDYGFFDLKIFHYQLPFSGAERNIIIARKDLSHQQ